MKLLKNSVIYILVSVISGGLSFLFLPILTSFLSADQFGTLELYRSSIALLQGLFIFGSNTLIFGNYFKWSKKELKIFIHNAIFISLVIGSVILSAVLFFPNLQDIIFERYSIPLIVIFIGILTSLIQSITAIQTTLFQIEGKAISYALFVVGFSLSSLLISYYFLEYKNYGWKSVVYGILFASTIFFLLTIFMFYKSKIGIINPFNKVKMILLLGSPLILTHIGGWVIEALDKFMITDLIDVSATGIYAVNYKFGIIVMMIQVGIIRAWSPFFYKEIAKNNNESKVKIIRYTYWLILILFLMTISVIMISPFLFDIFIVDDSYQFSWTIIVLVSFAYFFDGLWKIFNCYLINKNLTSYYAYTLIISAILNVVLNYYFIGEMGVNGAALATFISFLVGGFFAFVLSLRTENMPWSYFIHKK